MRAPVVLSFLPLQGLREDREFIGVKEEAVGLDPVAFLISYRL